MNIKNYHHLRTHAFLNYSKLVFLVLLIPITIKSPLCIGQNIYITPDFNFTLRTGAGLEYPTIEPSLPIGSLVKSVDENDSGSWSKITLENGKSGWIENRYLSNEEPINSNSNLAHRRVEVLNEENDKLRRQVNKLVREKTDLSKVASSSKSEFAIASAELAKLRQISKNTLSLDQLNNDLMKEKENLITKVATLDSENERLKERLDNMDFIQGALAVLLGVIICLAIPKLTPRSRQKNGWV